MSENTKLVENKIDVKLVVSYLTKSFNKINSTLPKANRDVNNKVNQTYKNECEFAYLINEIERGPECLITTNIAKANDFLTNLNNH